MQLNADEQQRMHQSALQLTMLNISSSGAFILDNKAVCHITPMLLQVCIRIGISWDTTKMTADIYSYDMRARVCSQI